MKINGTQMKAPVYCKLEGKPAGEPLQMRYQISAEWCLLSLEEVQSVLKEENGEALISVPDPCLGKERQISSKIKSTRAFLHGDKYRNVLVVWEEII